MAIEINTTVIEMGTWSSAPARVVRETRTTWVLHNGRKYRKTDLRAMGHSSAIRPLAEDEASAWNAWARLGRGCRARKDKCEAIGERVRHYHDSAGAGPLLPPGTDLAALDAALDAAIAAMGIKLK